MNFTGGFNGTKGLVSPEQAEVSLALSSSSILDREGERLIEALLPPSSTFNDCVAGKIDSYIKCV